MSSPIVEQYAEIDRETGADRKNTVFDPKTLKLTSNVKKQATAGETARQRWYSDAWVYLCYYTGRQWVEFDRSLSRPRERAKAPYEIRMVLNYTKTAVDAATAKLTQHQPGWLCPPVSEDERDVENARACERLLDYLWYQLQCRSKIQELVKWAAVTGIGVARVDFDSAATDTLGGPDEPGEPVIGTESAELEVETINGEAEFNVSGAFFDVGGGLPSGPTGFPTLEVIPPFSWICDPGATRKDLSDARWCVERRYLHIDEIRERWPETGKAVRITETVGADSTMGVLLQDFLGGDGQVTTEGLTTDRTEVLFYYERPSARHPRGYYVAIADDVVLEEHHELPAGRLPFVVIRYGSVPGRLYGVGIVEACKPTQDLINSQLSMRLEVVRKHASPHWYAETGSVAQAAITNKPGSIIWYAKGSRPPEQVPPPPISPQHEMLEAAGVQHLREISGINEISLGIVPGSISGRAAQWMAELDATKLSLVTSELEEAMCTLGGMLLKLWRDYMPPETSIQVLGDGSKMETWAFNSQAITTTSVRVVAGSMAVKHPSVKRETLVVMASQGVFGDLANDPEARARYLREMEFGTPEWTAGEADAESRYQREENYAILNDPLEFDEMGNLISPKVEVQPWQDHAAHIRELRMLLGSEEIREREKERFELARAHLAAHEGWLSLQRQGYEWWQEYAPELAAKLQTMRPQAQEAPPVPGVPPAEVIDPATGMPVQIDPMTGEPIDPFGGAPPMPTDPMGDLTMARGPGVAPLDSLSASFGLTS